MPSDLIRGWAPVFRPETRCEKVRLVSALNAEIDQAVEGLPAV